MKRKSPSTEEELARAAKRALTGENLVTETPVVEPEMPVEFVAFRKLLRQVVKPEPKRASDLAASDKD